MTAVLTPELACQTARRPRPAAVAAFLCNPRRALLAAAVLVVASVGFDALTDPDVWWHIRLGQWILDNHRVPTSDLFSYTAMGSPLTAHEWLSDTAFALLAAAGGLFLVALAVGIACWTGMIAIALRGRARGAGPLAIVLGLALGAKAAEPVLGARPQVLTFVLVGWTLWLADSYLRRGGRRVWLLPAVFLLWANLHAGFIVGLSFLALIVLAESIKRWLNQDAAPVERVRRLALATGAAALAACLNPAGPYLYRFAITVSATESQKPIVEWQTPNFHDPGLWALLALLVSFAALPALGGRLDLRDGLLAAAATALVLTAVRDTAICVAVLTPAWIGMAADVGRAVEARRTHGARNRRVRRWRVTPIGVTVGAAIVAIGAVAAGVSVARLKVEASPQAVAAAYPACASNVLARSPVPQRVFAEYGSAGYAVGRLYPHALMYEYGESISLGLPVFMDYMRIAADARTTPSALQLLAQSNTTAVLYQRGALTAQLDATPGWTRVLSDPSGKLLYLRGNAAWAAGSSCPR